MRARSSTGVVATPPSTTRRSAPYTKNGLASADKALALNQDYVDALVYRGLLLRTDAALKKKQA
jgi:hypothetical protein